MEKNLRNETSLFCSLQDFPIKDKKIGWFLLQVLHISNESWDAFYLVGSLQKKVLKKICLSMWLLPLRAVLLALGRLFTNMKQLARLTALIRCSEISSLEAFLYCPYMLLEYGVAADMSFTKAEGNHLVSQSWLFLPWFFETMLSTLLPQKTYFSSILPSIVSSWIWNLPVIKPVFSETFCISSVFLYWVMFFLYLRNGAIQLDKHQTIKCALYRRHCLKHYSAFAKILHFSVIKC